MDRAGQKRARDAGAAGAPPLPPPPPPPPPPPDDLLELPAPK